MADNVSNREPTEGRERRRVFFGDTFTSDELRDGLVELVEVEPNPNPPPEDEQVEPWGLRDDAPIEKHRLFHGRLRDYMMEHGHGHQ